MARIRLLMGVFGGAGLLAHRRTIAAAMGASLLSTAIVVAAVQADGSTATNVRLDDGAVWVTNQDDGLVGRLNVRILELDLGIDASGTADVLQETRPTGLAQPERTVLFSGKDGGVRQLDVISAQQTGDNEIPIVDYRIGGGVGAVLDRDTGALWVGSSKQVVAESYPEEPDALVAPGSRLVVTRGGSTADEGQAPPRGRVLIVDGAGWYEVELGEDLEPLREETEQDAEDRGDEAGTTSTATTEQTTAEPTVGAESETEEPAPLKEPVVTPMGISVDDVTDVSAVGDELVVLLQDGTVVQGDRTTSSIPGD